MTDTARVGAALGAALVICALLVGGWNWHSRQLSSARRDAEAARLALANQIVTTEETRRELQGSVADLLERNAALQDAYAKARAAAPGAVPVSAARLDTGPLKVLPPSPLAQVMPLPPARPASAPPRACSLFDDDTLRIEVDQITLQAKAGNALIAGTATAHRQTPELLETVLATGPFTASLSTTEALAPPVEPRWGVLAQGICEAQGCGLGAGVLFPPLKLWGLRIEGQATVLAGPVVAATAGVGVRW